MGKCSGLKGGGHHRKAIDIANKKRTEKQSIKKEKEAAGKRTLILQEILSGELGSIYKDCDIYLQQQQQQDMNDRGGSKGKEEDGGSSRRNGNIELCREHFRYENCCNRRCKFSHEYTIADALQNVISGTNTSSNSSKSNSDIDNSSITTTTIPALQFISIDGERQQKRRHHRSRLVRPTSIKHNANVEDGISSLQLDDNHTPSPLENASIVNTIITYIQSNQDVLNLALSCRYIHQTILLEEGGNINVNGCPDVTRRKRQVKECQLDERNNTLLANSKAIGGRLRYIVGYVQGTSTVKSGKKKDNNNKKSNKNRNDTCVAQHQQRRPVLIYDYENPNVFAAFRESALVVVAAQKKNRVESQNDVS